MRTTRLDERPTSSASAHNEVCKDPMNYVEDPNLLAYCLHMGP